MGVTYSWAPEVKVIAETLIPRFHNHLISEDIRYVFRSEAAKSGGRVVLGKARKVSGFNAFLGTVSTGEVLDDGEEAPSFFVIEIAHDHWMEMTRAQSVALVDHELMHCDIQVNDKGEAQLVLKGHDLEEFRAVVERHGLWKPDIRAFVEIGAKQLELFGEQPEPRAAGTLHLVKPDAEAAGPSATGEDSGVTVLDTPPEDEIEEEPDFVPDSDREVEPDHESEPREEAAATMGDDNEDVREEDIFNPARDHQGVTTVVPEGRPAPPDRPPHQPGDGPRTVPFNADDYEAVQGAAAGERVDLDRPTGTGQRDEVLHDFLKED